MSHYSFYSVNVNAGILARQVLYPTYITGPMIHNSTNARRCETAVCTDKPHAHTHTASHTPNQLYSKAPSAACCCASFRRPLDLVASPPIPRLASFFF